MVFSDIVKDYAHKFYLDMLLGRDPQRHAYPPLDTFIYEEGEAPSVSAAHRDEFRREVQAECVFYARCELLDLSEALFFSDTFMTPSLFKQLKFDLVFRQDLVVLPSETSVGSRLLAYISEAASSSVRKKIVKGGLSSLMLPDDGYRENPSIFFKNEIQKAKSTLESSADHLPPEEVIYELYAYFADPKREKKILQKYNALYNGTSYISSEGHLVDYIHHALPKAPDDLDSPHFTADGRLLIYRSSDAYKKAKELRLTSKKKRGRPKKQKTTP